MNPETKKIHGKSGNIEASDMIQLEKSLVTKPDNLNSSPSIHMVKQKSQLLKIVLWPTQCDYNPFPTHMHIDKYM